MPPKKRVATRESTQTPAGALADDAASNAKKTKQSAVRARVDLPRTLAPQLATPVTKPPSDADAWQWEIKIDGYRILARIEGGHVSLMTRNGLDWTGKFPALAQAIQALPINDAWLDGEFAAIDAHGVPDFGLLQKWFSAGSQRINVVYLVFDAPFLDGNDLREEPLYVRRATLEAAFKNVSTKLVRLTDVFTDTPQRLLAATKQAGLEGLIGKRKQSSYRAGRSSDWIKLKHHNRQEFIIAGYTAGEGHRSDFGSLVLALHDAAGQLRHVGNVGTGFDDVTIKEVLAQLAPLQVSASPLALIPAELKRDVVWVKPDRVAEVQFMGWTKSGHIRAGAFKGLRADRDGDRIEAERAENARTQTDAQEHSQVSTPSSPQTQKTRGTKRLSDASSTAASTRVAITHGERVLDRSTGSTKGDLAHYYTLVAPLMLPHLAARPVALNRAPHGIDAPMFFQKHVDENEIQGITPLDPALDPGHEPLIEINRAEGLLGTVQMNAVEFHTWNALHAKIENPDRFILDIDPGEGVSFARVREAALLIRALLEEVSLESFCKTSGGKGLHVVVPIAPRYSWDAVFALSKRITQHLAATIPDRFVEKSGPKNRVGKIFVDYLRNRRGATTVAAWSARARPGLGISVPIEWAELGDLRAADAWTISNVEARLHIGNAPWSRYAQLKQTLTRAFKLMDVDSRATEKDT